MRRPEFIQHLFIQSKDFLTVKVIIALKKRKLDFENIHFPLEDIPLLRRQFFTLKLILFNENKEIISQHLFDTDSFGQAVLRIPLQKKHCINLIRCFETAYSPGVEFLLGDFYPLRIETPSKIVISDFDKTLINTSYSGILDVITSLVNPIDYFPSIENGLDLFKSYIKKDYVPFVLSASPHFYEATIHTWLWQQDLRSCSLFLKDYRQSFSLSDGLLAPKDLWTQGLYKLDQLLDLLIMCSLPDEIVLLGDDFESDPMIYLTLSQIITNTGEPFRLWQKIIENPSFKFSKKQKAKLLSKIYEISSFLYDKKKQGYSLPKISIFIRKTKKTISPPSELETALQNKISYHSF